MREPVSGQRVVEDEYPSSSGLHVHRCEREREREKETERDKETEIKSK